MHLRPTLLIVVVLGVHGAQQAPGGHVGGRALALRLQRQHRLAQQPALEQRPPLRKAVRVLHPPKRRTLAQMETGCGLRHSLTSTA